MICELVVTQQSGPIPGVHSAAMEDVYGEVYRAIEARLFEIVPELPFMAVVSCQKDARIG